MNASDPRSVRKAKQSEKQKEREERKDLECILSTIQGRRFVWKQLTEAGCFRLDWEADKHGFNDFCTGRRSLGLKLMAEVHALDPALYTQMAREANAAREITEIVNEDKKDVDPELSTEDADHA